MKYLQFCNNFDIFGNGQALSCNFQQEKCPDSIYRLSGSGFYGYTNAGYHKELDVNVPLEEDASLKENYSVYADLARNNASKFHLINGEISEITYECQGSSGNNPDISIRVIGENGIMTFSRYDQTLLGIITGTSNKISDSAWGAVLDESEADEATISAQ